VHLSFPVIYWGLTIHLSSTVLDAVKRIISVLFYRKENFNSEWFTHLAKAEELINNRAG
jgi:hypothetical protein